MSARTRGASRRDSAHHRNAYDPRHKVARGARMARHLVFACIKPLRALEALIYEIDRLRLPVNPVVLAQARIAWDHGRPYLEDENGDVWR